tara:strand:- start:2179 stop:2442 length:264 start_codon:yes stop_codon:yes gene_type:complete
MKIFIYKLIISLFAVYVLFEFTIGSRIDYFKDSINSLKDNDQRILIKEKIKNELRKAINKENYFTEEERFLISSFIKKIKIELELDQ